MANKTLFKSVFGGFAPKVFGDSSLCNLCILCVSAVNDLRPKFTTETQRTQRLHRETSAQVLLGQSCVLLLRLATCSAFYFGRMVVSFFSDPGGEFRNAWEESTIWSIESPSSLTWIRIVCV